MKSNSVRLNGHRVEQASIRARVSIPTGLDGKRSTLTTFHNLADGKEHFAVTFGAAETQPVPLVRLHSECITGDVFQSQRCDCGQQLQEAIATMQQWGGVLIYLRQEGRGIGLFNKMDAYLLQDEGYDTFEANEMLGFASDERDYRPAAQMLQALDIDTIRLFSNSPDKINQLRHYGINVMEQVPTACHVNKNNSNYLMAKRVKMKHMIALNGDSEALASPVDVMQGISAGKRQG